MTNLEGCIEVDEVNGLFFLSDTNHHRIIVFASNGEILDHIRSYPGFEDGEFESSKIMRHAALLYDDAEDSMYLLTWSYENNLDKVHLSEYESEAASYESKGLTLKHSEKPR
ncbi:hypothetical protein Tco_1290667 [Tanacetum coccineum]